MSWSLFLRMDANTLIMGTCHSRGLVFYMLQHPKSLTLCWQSVDAVWMLCWQSVDAQLTLILRCSSIDAHDITYKGCQYSDYGYMPYHSPWIIQDVTPKIVDALLTLIFRLGMRPCHFLFCPSRLPICWLWIPASKCHPNGLTYKTRNCWHSVDAQCQNVAVTD
jgi:hypothetical protein